MAIDVVSQIETDDHHRVGRIHKTLVIMRSWSHCKEIEAGAAKEYGMSEREFYQAWPEFLKFMALTKEYTGLGMTSAQIDKIWHSLILNTALYRDFCTVFIGRFVDHLPCSSYELYGITDTSMCKTPPSSCTDPYPAPPDPSPVPSVNTMQSTILTGAFRFVQAYTETFGYPPDSAIWQSNTRPDAFAQ